MSDSFIDQHSFKRILNRNIGLPLGFGLLSAVFFCAIVYYLLEVGHYVERSVKLVGTATETLKQQVDLETGMRGYLIAGDETFLEPYVRGLPKLRLSLDQLRSESDGDPSQLRRVEQLESLHQQWYAFSQAAIERRRQGLSYEDYVKSGRGKLLMEQFRTEIDDYIAAERRVRYERTATAETISAALVGGFLLFSLIFSGLLVILGRRDLMSLSTSYGESLNKQQLHAQALEKQAWYRTGQMQLSEAIIGELTLPALGQSVLSFLSRYIDVAAGALYVMQEGRLHRVAEFGYDKEQLAQHRTLDLGEGLVGQVALERRPMALSDLPQDYLKVSSALGDIASRSVLIAPIEDSGTLNAVLELGFLRPLEEEDGELLKRIADNVGSAIEAARYRQRLQQILSETQQLNEEQRASRYKSEFLANMSHELRTPLNSSLILAKLLADNPHGNLSDDQVQFARSIYSAGNDLLSLINDILDISKVEAGKLDVLPEVTVLPRLLDGIKSLFLAQAIDKSLQFDVEAEEGLPPSIFTDRQRLEQILKNLLSNAFKFTEKGSVTLRVRRHGMGQLAFAVSDSGIGIPKDQQSVIFEAFRQADGTTNRRYGGTGLGLSISRELAQLLGGHIEVESEPGSGSTFTLVLPENYVAPVTGSDAVEEPARAAQPALPAAVEPSRPAPASVVARPAARPAAESAGEEPIERVPDDRDTYPFKNRCVLIIEDEPQFARILCDLAHELNYSCLIAHNADGGYDTALEYRPDAILLDMRLPDHSGLTVLERLKENPVTRHIPVHIVSVEDRREAALHMGAVGYAQKPATREELRSVFERLEAKLAQKVKRILLVEDDVRQRESVSRLIEDTDVEIAAVGYGEEALELLRNTVFDCVIIDLKLPDMDGHELLERMAHEEICSFPPVIVYTGRNLTRDEEASLMKYSRSIIIKGARSPERLLDEVTLFLHKVESEMPPERQKMLKSARSREKAFEGRKILVVDDDVRNVFALTSALEQKGALVEIARNGHESIAKLQQVSDIDLVLMDIMMPEMDGFTAMQEIRKDPKFAKLPIIAVTAKAMKNDQERCLKAGANDYLAKPIDLDRLFSLIRVWLPKVELL